MKGLHEQYRTARLRAETSQNDAACLANPAEAHQLIIASIAATREAEELAARIE